MKDEPDAADTPECGVLLPDGRLECGDRVSQVALRGHPREDTAAL